MLLSAIILLTFKDKASRLDLHVIQTNMVSRVVGVVHMDLDALVLEDKLVVKK